MKKVAFFVDWDNLRKTIEQINKVVKIKNFNFNNASHISTLFKNFLCENEEFYRIFFYTAKPLSSEEIKSQLSKKDKEIYKNENQINKVFDIASKFLKDIVSEDFIALRTGKLKVRGLKNSKPAIIQKQVDMLIGLDISEISYKKLADKIVVFSKDTDMIPALKTARINGLTVSIANFKESNFISDDIILHSDLVCEKSLKEIANKIKKPTN